jgi:hypothetical protein
MVEIEIGVLRGQCLDRRIDERERLVSEIAAWERQRNGSCPMRWCRSGAPRRVLSPCQAAAMGSLMV